LKTLGSKLFGSSGVRGLVNAELTPLLAAKIALTVATFSKAKRVLVARDTRVSGLMLENALVSGLLAGGASVNCVGVLPTPTLAYLTKKLNVDVGFMITASHNPPEYNGIKIFNNDSTAYDEKSQDKIERAMGKEKLGLTDWRDAGEVSYIDKSFLYIEKLKTVELHKKWHIVVDPGCGATHTLSTKIFRNLKCKMTAINAQPDGFFPARSPEPNADTLKPLAKIVQELGADVGIAYDGDGDRVAFIDEKGNFLDFDRVLSAYAACIVKKKGRGIVVTNVEASMGVEKMVEKEGGRVARTKVGDVYVAEAVKRYGALFGGEPCGAWIHPQFNYCPDGILSSVLFLKTLENEKKSVSDFIAEVPQYMTLRENFSCKNDVKYIVVEKVREGLKSVFPACKKISTVDGVRLALESAWILVRASGTEPLIRLTAEGESLKAAKQIMGRGVTLVKRFVGEMVK